MSDDNTPESGYVMRIYADPNGRVGHFAVGIEGPDGVLHKVVGKYPDDASKSRGLVWSVDGDVRDDTDRMSQDGVVPVEIDLPDKAAADAAVGFLKDGVENPGAYQAFTDSCVDFAQGALDAADVDENVADLFPDDFLDEMGEIRFGAGDAAQTDRDQRRREEHRREAMRKRREQRTHGRDAQDADASAQYPARDRKERRSEAPAREAASAAPAAMDAGLRDRAARELAAIPELEGIQLKPPADWTEGEMRRLLRDPLYWDGPEPDRVALRDGVAGWLAARYGTAPARRDGTGRMVEPAFQKTPLAEAVEARTPDPAPLDRALAGIADALGRAGAAVGPTQAVRRFQGGLNRLSAALTAAEPAQPSRPAGPGREPGAAFYEEAAARARPRIGRLKEDGIFGPKTAKATRAALTRAGRAPVERAAAGGVSASDPGDAYSLANPARPTAFGASPLAERTRGRRVISALED
eukprot:g15288.t1